MKKALYITKLSLTVLIMLLLIYLALTMTFLKPKTAAPVSMTQQQIAQLQREKVALQQVIARKEEVEHRFAMTSNFTDFKAQAGEIVYFDATHLDAQVKAAIDFWNNLELGVIFTETFNRNQAELFLKHDPEVLQAACELTCLGFLGSNQATASQPGVIVLHTFEDYPSLALKTTLHELGHYLGLPHSELECSVMKQGYPCSSKQGAFIELSSEDQQKLSQLYSDADLPGETISYLLN